MFNRFRLSVRRRSHPGWIVALLVLAVLVPQARATLDPVGNEFQVSVGTGLPGSPTVAMDPSSGSVVVWEREDGIAGRRYDSAGQALGGEFVANTDPSEAVANPAVAIDANGAFVVLWESFEIAPIDFVIRGCLYDATGSPVGEFQVDSAATDRQYDPVVAFDPAGGFLVVWEGHNLSQNTVDSSVIFAQRYDDSGAPIGEESRVSGPARRFAAAPAMATDSTGNLVVVWEGPSGGDDAGIFGQRYDPTGAATGVEFRISATTGEPEFAPSVTKDAAGGIAVVWMHSPGYTSQIIGRRYDGEGMPVGDVFGVATDSGFRNSAATVASLPNGAFLVVWQKNIFRGPGEIAARQYLPSGAPDGDEISVNPVADGDQNEPALSVDAAGNVLVVWRNLPGDGSGSGVFGRRYMASPPDVRPSCAGDCNGDHHVALAELVRSINLVLDSAPPDSCPGSDVDGDGAVTIGELVAAVRVALNGC